MSPPPTVSPEERLARVALNRLGEPGDLRLASLTAELGAVVLLDLLRSERDRDGLLTDVAARLVDLHPERELEAAARSGLRFLVPGDAEWPSQLADLAGAGSLHDRGGIPVGLWVRGPLRLDSLTGSVSVVGSRGSTTYGDAIAHEIGQTVAGAGHAVVSGAAFGIDISAHRGAVGVEGPTVAVLACGADRSYPLDHRHLIDHIAEVGAVVSEAAPGCAPQRIRFLARNRLIAALARVTVVVEAARRSGALNTATWAQRLNRTVLGVPGPVTSQASAGVHAEIRSGAMGLVTGGGDVLELVGAAGEHLVEVPQRPRTARDRLATRHQQVLDAVPVGTGATSESIARVAGIGLLEVSSTLTRLHRDQLVELDHDGWRLGAAART